MSERPRRALIGLASFLAISAALVVAVIAWAIYEVICDEGCSTSPPYRTWQLVLALVAIAPVTWGARLLLLRRVRAACGLFALALGFYAAWVVVLVDSA